MQYFQQYISTIDSENYKSSATAEDGRPERDVVRFVKPPLCMTHDVVRFVKKPLSGGIRTSV